MFTLTFQDLAVLLVEPSPVQARIIREALGRLGVVRIATAENGAGALAALRQAAPAVVVSAMYLPDCTGVDLVHTMREDATLAMTPFVLVSSETLPQRLEAIRQAGACLIVPKPFADAQLAAALRRVLDFVNPAVTLDVDADLERLRVLIVDDSANARRFIRHVLGQLGIEHFVEAGNGREAIEALAETMVDLVVTDYNMPEMDGRELIEHIRGQSWQSSVPILMVTSEADMGRLAAVEQAGVSAICDKPFEPEMVKRLIEQALAAGAAG